MDKTFNCKVCTQLKPAAHFAAAERSFYTCRQCASKRQSERRRSDPAVRLACRVRMRAKRYGFAVKLRVADIRTLLKRVNPRYVEADLVKLERIRMDAPLTPDNVALRQAAVLSCGEGMAQLSSGTIPFVLGE